MASKAVAHPLQASALIDGVVCGVSTMVTLDVQMLTGRTVTPNVTFPASSPVASVKEVVHAASAIPMRRQRLIWQGAVLEDGTLLTDLALPTEGATLQLVVSLPPEDRVAQARVLMQQAAVALDVLTRKDICELKSLHSPPAGVDLVLEAVMQLQAGVEPSIVVDSQGRLKDSSWKASRNMMKDPSKFLADLRGFKTLVENGRVPARNVDAACRIRDSMGEDFSFDAVKVKSFPAANLTAWVLNIIHYHRVCAAICAEFEGFDIMAELSELTGAVTS